MNKSIIICGIIRNGEKGLKVNIPAIRKICEGFNDYRVLIFENDSKDRTKQLLGKWVESDPQHVVAIMKNFDKTETMPKFNPPSGVNKAYSHLRIDRMAALRNDYMEYIDAHNWSADYLMVVDLDVSRIWPKYVLEAFEDERQWDAISAYGYHITPYLRVRYFDRYALTLWKDKDVPQTQTMIRENKSLDMLKKDHDWVSVASAFGGLVVYKFEAVKGLRYQIIDNDDTRVEVRCEHYSIFKQMLERGYDKFYVVPSMRLRYRDFTFRGFSIQGAWNGLKNTIKKKCHL